MSRNRQVKRKPKGCHMEMSGGKTALVSAVALVAAFGFNYAMSGKEDAPRQPIKIIYEYEQPSAPLPALKQEPKKERVKDLAFREAKRAGVKPELGHGLVLTESNGNAQAVSKVGACGLTQLMPGTAKEMGVKDCKNPHQNVRGGMGYLAKLKARYGDDTLALVAYNWGMGNTDKWLKRGGDWSRLPKETRDYVSKVKVAAAVTKLAMSE